VNQAIIMPALSDTMNNGRLVKWLKKIGDPIKKGESVADVETDKAVMDLEAFHDGFLAGPLVAEGSELPVGATIGYIADAAAASPGEAQPAASAPTPPKLSTPLSARTAEPAVERVRASPYARRLARERGVDVKRVISEQADVHAEPIANAAGQPMLPELAAGPPYRIERASSVRAAVAHSMIGSLAIPSFRVTARLALAPLLAVAKDTRLSLTLLLARACALTIKAHPLFNAVYTADGFALRERVDVAIAVDTPEGLMAPVIRDVAERPLTELATDWRNLREKSLSRRLSAQEYQGATFYLSNLGPFSVVYSFDAVLPQGASAILCVAAADGDRTSFTLGCDHRVLAGADAARFLQTLAEILANPKVITETSQPQPQG
jgi:pyruvate dehydrogenase E2 component (dihydrolipoamide acetyltransferase)